MELRTILVLLGLLAMPFATAEEAYVWTDEDGVVHYSDRPQPGARRIELSEPNTGQSPRRRRPTTRLKTRPRKRPLSVTRASQSRHPALKRRYGT